MAPKYVILIINPETGDLACIPTVLHAQNGQEIIFSARLAMKGYEPTLSIAREELLPFLVRSKGISPFNEVELASNAEGTARAIVRTDATPGEYSLTCAVSHDGGIYMDAGCPSIIIGPRGT